MNTAMWTAIVGSVVRWAVTVGGVGTAVSGDEVTQFVGGGVAFVSLGWSIWQKIAASRAGQPPRGYGG